METLPVKKHSKPLPDGGLQTIYLVPAMAIMHPGGKQLVLNSAGRESKVFDTMEQAIEACYRAGFGAEVDGVKLYPNAAHKHNPASSSALQTLQEEAYPLLLSALNEREASALAHAVFALGELRKADAIPHLCKLLGHDDATVRRQLSESLTRFGAPVLTALIEQYKQASLRSEPNARLTRLTVLQTFMEMLQRDSHNLDDALPIMLLGLKDENWLVRACAYQVTGLFAEKLYNTSV
jgi:HEAT repeat protein